MPLTIEFFLTERQEETDRRGNPNGCEVDAFQLHTTLLGSLKKEGKRPLDPEEIEDAIPYLPEMEDGSELYFWGGLQRRPEPEVSCLIRKGGKWIRHSRPKAEGTYGFWNATRPAAVTNCDPT